MGHTPRGKVSLVPCEPSRWFSSAENLGRPFQKDGRVFWTIGGESGAKAGTRLTLVSGEKWELLYAEAVVGLDLLRTVEEAVVWANDLVRRIAAAG